MSDAYVLARSIVSKLTSHGFIAYFAGGWVRDHLLGHPSEDIDIATDAHPEQVMSLFSQTVLVGLAFGVVIVILDGHQFEVATFRRDVDYFDGRHPQRIEMSTPREDALRRDFTINGMFYDPLENVIHDFVGGKKDLEYGIVRAIGDPQARFYEDRLRILRAFRFASRFGFHIELETQTAIRENVDKMFPAVAMERVWQEFTKMACYPRFDQALIEMHRLGVLSVIFPELEYLHLHDLQLSVGAFSQFPVETPSVFFLLHLFKDQNLITKIEIMRRLKMSNKELKLAELQDRLYAVLKDPTTRPHVWAKLYSDGDFQQVFQATLAGLPEAERTKLRLEDNERQKKLEKHVQRLKKGIPLVNSHRLEVEGIKPGRLMGALLKEAEQLVIDQDIHDAELIITQLKQLPMWRQN